MYLSVFAVMMRSLGWLRRNNQVDLLPGLGWRLGLWLGRGIVWGEEVRTQPSLTTLSSSR